MPRAPRELQGGYCYHVTIRCNNREFHLSDRACREVLLYALQRALLKYRFKLYALCIMTNHVHYLLEPAQAEDLPRIMHWLNWYTAMCFNQMLNRTGHFWEKRYYSAGFPVTDRRRALHTLRYIHANPRAAGIARGYFADFSNYGNYERLTDDGLMQWHPAFLELADTLGHCARHYRRFCQAYQPRTKAPAERRGAWGRHLLAGLQPARCRGPFSGGAGQLALPWSTGERGVRCQVGAMAGVRATADRFLRANRLASAAARR
jgi:putative transposase